jgi:RND family efflux transporter MFP subunit
MVDLDRLKISDARPARGGGKWLAVLLCLLCLGAGFGAAKLIDRWPLESVPRVRVEVVRASAGGAGRQFTAGGWVEATTPAYPIVVSCRISERLEQLLVHEGQSVEPNQVVARLYDRDSRSRLAVARAQRAAATKELEKLQAGFRIEDVQVAEAQLAKAAEELRIAEANHRRSQALKPGTISAERLDTELSAVRTALAVHAKARAELKKLQAGYRTEDIAAARAELDKAESLVQLAELELSYCTIHAPSSDNRLRVLKILHNVGQWVDARRDAALVWLYDPADMQVRVDVRQGDVKAVRVGGESLIVTEAHPRKRYNGKVLRIEPLAELSKNTVTVRVRIEDPDELLFPEMVAQVTFLTDAAQSARTRPAELRVPAAAVLGESGARYVFVSRDGLARRQDVTVRETDGSRAVIGKGLQSGQRIIVSGLRELRDGQRIEEE